MRKARAKVSGSLWYSSQCDKYGTERDIVDSNVDNGNIRGGFFPNLKITFDIVNHDIFFGSLAYIWLKIRRT